MNFEMTNEKKVELRDILDNLSDSEKMSLLEEYSVRDKMDIPSYIAMEEIDEYLADWTPSQIILSLATNFSCSDDGFWIHANGDLHSGTISEYFADNYCSIDIERWLEGEEEEETEQVAGTSGVGSDDSGPLPDDNISQYGSDDDSSDAGE